MMRSVSVVSGKGGTGKSFVTCNVGVLLAKANFRVMIVDADVDLANVELMYGIAPEKTLQDLVENRANPEEVVCEGVGGVLVAPAGVKLERRIRPSEFDHVVGLLSATYDVDYLLIDAPAGLNAFVTTCVKITDEYLLVTNPEVTSIADAYKVKILADQNGKHLGTVLNRVHKPPLDMKRVAQTIGPIIAAVPFDDKVPATINDGVPYVVRYPETLVSKQLAKVASAISNVEIVLSSKSKFGFKIPFRRG